MINLNAPKQYLIYTRTPWEEVPRARHQFAQALSNFGNVLFIAANKVSLIPRLSFNKVSDTLTIIQPHWWLPFKVRYRIPFLNTLYNRWLFSAVKRASIGPIYHHISFDHTSIGFSREFNNYSYYVNDDHTRKGSKKLNLFLNAHVKNESLLAQNAQFVVTTAMDLYQKFYALNQNTCLIPLGAPPVLVKPFLPENQGLLKVCFLSVFNSRRIPVNLIEQILNSFPIELVCIGPYDEAFGKAMDAFENVKLCGPMQGIDLQERMAECHVGIAPYTTGSENAGVTPNKLWQYLGVGLPVVYTHLKGIEFGPEFSDLITCSIENREFGELIVKSAVEDSLAKRERRQAIALENSWDARAQQFVYYLEKGENHA